MCRRVSPSLLRRNSVLFCCQRGTNETSEASSALSLLPSVDIWFLPNQQLVHTFLPVVSYYGAAGLLRGIILCASSYAASPNWPKPNICPLVGSDMSCNLALSQLLHSLASYLVL